MSIRFDHVTSPTDTESSLEDVAMASAEHSENELREGPLSIAYRCATNYFLIQGRTGLVYITYQNDEWSEQIEYVGDLTVDGVNCAVYGLRHTVGRCRPKIKFLAFAKTPHGAGLYSIHRSRLGLEWAALCSDAQQHALPHE